MSDHLQGKIAVIQKYILRQHCGLNPAEKLRTPYAFPLHICRLFFNPLGSFRQTKFTFRQSPRSNRMNVLLVLAFWAQAGPSTHSDDFCPLLLWFLRSNWVLSFNAVNGRSLVNITLLHGHAVASIKSASFSTRQKSIPVVSSNKLQWKLRKIGKILKKSLTYVSVCILQILQTCWKKWRKWNSDMDADLKQKIKMA